MFVDYIKIKIESGAGGYGSVSRFASKATGGDGGNGGDVVLLGDTNTYDLFDYTLVRKYKAEDGKSGLDHNKRGPDGKDLILKLPLTSEIRVNGELVETIDTHGQKYIIAKGGTGALGNTTLQRKSHHNPSSELIAEWREPQTIFVEITLKLKADVILIGYPNAGKSSLLNELTNANVKTAAYAFTTLQPQLGMFDHIKIMDLPGLIDGTAEGKGLGTDFVKHTENSKIMLHLVSLENNDPLKTYLGLKEELSKISQHFDNLEEVIVLSKTDSCEKEFIEKVRKQFTKRKLKTELFSIIDDKLIKEIKQLLKTRFKNEEKL